MVGGVGRGTILGSYIKYHELLSTTSFGCNLQETNYSRKVIKDMDNGIEGELVKDDLCMPSTPPQGLVRRRPTILPDEDLARKKFNLVLDIFGEVGSAREKSRIQTRESDCIEIQEMPQGEDTNSDFLVMVAFVLVYFIVSLRRTCMFIAHCLVLPRLSKYCGEI